MYITINIQTAPARNIQIFESRTFRTGLPKVETRQTFWFKPKTHNPSEPEVLPVTALASVHS